MAILIIVNLVSIIFCYVIAKYRKAKVIYWVLAALLVGPLAIPFVFLAKPVDQNN